MDFKTPVPADKHTFCGVCNLNYTDFKEHISSPTHIDCVKSNKYSIYNDIDSLITEFN